MTRKTIELADLIDAVSAGGAGCLTSNTDLRPAAGAHAAVAPAKFASKSDYGTYAYEKRYDDGELADVVLIDSKQSQLNRFEAELVKAIHDGDETLSRMPRLLVSYDRAGKLIELSDVEMPHRGFDAHFRAGYVDGTPTTQLDFYRALRDSSPSDARALFDASPISIIFGSWDSHRKAQQGKWRSIVTGEIIGFCAPPNKVGEEVMKGGGRIDPLGAKIELSAAALKALMERQREGLGGATTDEKAKKASAAGLGAIAPNLGALAGVACRRIIRSHVLSFAALRQIRFGAGPDGDAACRALLAALALNGLARSDAELNLRANCDLVEAGEQEVVIHGRGGSTVEYEPLTVDAADQLLADALAHAEKTADVVWNGVVLRIDGDPAIVQGAGESDGPAA